MLGWNCAEFMVASLEPLTRSESELNEDIRFNNSTSPIRLFHIILYCFAFTFWHQHHHLHHYPKQIDIRYVMKHNVCILVQPIFFPGMFFFQVASTWPLNFQKPKSYHIIYNFILIVTPKNHRGIDDEKVFAHFFFFFICWRRQRH